MKLRAGYAVLPRARGVFFYVLSLTQVVSFLRPFAGGICKEWLIFLYCPTSNPFQ